MKKIYKKKIFLSELINFWKNPIVFFLKKKFNLIYNNYPKYYSSQELFLLNKLDIYKINKKIFYILLKNRKLKKSYLHNKIFNVVKKNNFEKFLLEKQINEIKEFYKKIYNIDNFSKIKKKNIKIKKYNLQGDFHENTKYGLLKFKPYIVNIYDEIKLWLQHIIYCYFGNTKNSYLIGLKKSFCGFHNINQKTAEKYIKKYITGYLNGLKKPILINKSSINWFTTIYDTKKKKINKNKLNKGKKKFMQIWNGNNFVVGEKKNLHIKKLIPKLTEKKIDILCNNTKIWLTPIYKNKIIKNPWKKNKYFL
ncbi:hypothetical protein RJU59_01745 [Buchnera aphidicola (Kurisakia onigurumii)]|uniref:hypothetical protein n=1 Tax=Buchnera aphidicola TaxID=9 RepID=UPI0031B678B2